MSLLNNSTTTLDAEKGGKESLFLWTLCSTKFVLLIKVIINCNIPNNDKSNGWYKVCSSQILY